MRPFARFKNETWRKDLAYVDELSKDINGVKCLLVRQDLFDRTVDSRRMKTKYSNEKFKTFSELSTKNKRPKKVG